MPNPTARLPAEWETQSAVIIAWPHEGTDWAARLAHVERSYSALAVAVLDRQALLLCVPDSQVRAAAERALGDYARHPDLHWVEVEYDDTWLRDSGPITLRDANGPVFLDFRFTGWGGKYAANRDDRLIASLLAQKTLRGRHEVVDFALEGGAIESDGAGSILSTWRCLHARHPTRSRSEIEMLLCDRLRARRIQWLESGYLQGDDTDAHIDTLARFAPDDGIIYQSCDDRNDSHFEPLRAMANEIAALRTLDGRAYRTHALPWGRPIYDQGRRLAASYANYLVINGAVLVPAYDDPSDDAAAAIIAAAHPGRIVIQIPCRALIWQNGSLHCITMQLPQGAFA